MKAAIVFCALLGLVLGWGEVGHKAIAELARDRLTQDAKAAVAHYLGAMEMYQVAPQPDTYAFSPAGHWSEPFHFYNMNRGDTSYHASECPNPPSCNVYAIQNFSRVLNSLGGGGPFCSSENDPADVFPCPLIWLIHVVGDVHQPLHCGYGYDRGGNDVKCTFFGQETELHAVWDTDMIYHYLDPTDGDWYDLYKYLSSDLSNNPGREQQYASIRDPVAWANESIAFVVNDVYNFNPSSLSKRGEPQLGQAYYNQNFPIACQRMEAAGVRLAQVLNNAFQGFLSKSPSAAKAHFDNALQHQVARIVAKKKEGVAATKVIKK